MIQEAEDYKDWLKIQTPANAATSVYNILNNNTPIPNGPEDDYYQIWKDYNDIEKETSENQITDSLFAEIPTTEHASWESAFAAANVVFTGAEAESLAAKCRKRRPQP